MSGAVLTEQIFHHSGFRQADHRCGVQSRLRGGAGRGADHRTTYIALIFSLTSSMSCQSADEA